MTTYAIGDVQGCAHSLEHLLDRIEFDREHDRIWFVGDLVNRGPSSLEVLRWARDHDDCIVCVLGNHDLHLLARWMGAAGSRAKDTVDDVLSAPDRDELLEWLRRRPLLHREDDFLLLHAGLLPAWTVEEAERWARFAERTLRSPDAADWMRLVTERRDEHWTDELSEEARAALATRVLCNLRGCDRSGEPLWGFSGPPEAAPAELIPWYAHPDRRWRGATMVCGHWAAQGLRLLPEMIALDTGCVWGNVMTAIDLATRQTFVAPLLDPVASHILGDR